jgi:membrane protein implicated in regulation of membrane protease activity
MHPVVWWIATAVVFFILELTTASFFFLWIGAGAVVTALLSLVVNMAWVEYATFAGSSILLVALSRRWAPRFSGKVQRSSNIDALIGQTAIVTKVDDHNSFMGYAKVDGEIWKAESEDQKPLKVDGKVSVVAVKGNILVVKI